MVNVIQLKRPWLGTLGSAVALFGLIGVQTIKPALWGAWVVGIVAVAGVMLYKAER